MARGEQHVRAACPRRTSWNSSVFFLSSPLVDNNILLFLLIVERSNSLCDKIFFMAGG